MTCRGFRTTIRDMPAKLISLSEKHSLWTPVGLRSQMTSVVVEMVDDAPWDQRLARVLVRPLRDTPVTPNQITTLSLLAALGAGACFSLGSPEAANWGAALFMVSRFVDHMDGELARLSGKISRLGYFYDTVVDTVSYGVLFVGLAIGFSGRLGGPWIEILVVLAVIASTVNSIIRTRAEIRDGIVKPGFPSYAGFQLEDGIYLIGPITWAGYLFPFFILTAAGAVLYAVWTFWDFIGRRLWQVE